MAVNISLMLLLVSVSLYTSSASPPPFLLSKRQWRTPPLFRNFQPPEEQEGPTGPLRPSPFNMENFRNYLRSQEQKSRSDIQVYKNYKTQICVLMTLFVENSLNSLFSTIMADFTLSVKPLLHITSEKFWDQVFDRIKGHQKTAVILTKFDLFLIHLHTVAILLTTSDE